MKSLLAILVLPMAMLPSGALAKKAPAEYPVTYAGGSLPLSHNKIRAALGQDEVVLIQHDRRISIPAKSITEISCGAEAHRHLMSLVHLGESQDYYIGVAWSGQADAMPAQVLLKLSRGEYREFLSALERLTGIKAVDTNQVPTVVRYNS